VTVSRCLLANSRVIGNWELGGNPFDYLTELQRYAEGLVSKPADWMPWNYRNTLERGVASGEAPG
jgi:hypothetical protein